MAKDITKKQHYVWRHYLSAWKNAHDDKTVWAGIIEKNSVLKLSLMDIAQSSYFYKLEVLSDDELNFLRKYSLTLSKNVQSIAYLIIYGYKLFTQLKNVEHGLDKDFEHEISKIEMTTFETIQSQIELMGKDLLKCNNINDIENLTKKDETNLLYFLWVQYLRTKAMKDRVVTSLNEKQNLKNIGLKCWPFFNLVTALQIVEGMIKDNSYRFIFVSNIGEIPFITGDQPAINLRGDVKDDNGYAKELELYYPLSPKSAIMISFTAGDKFSTIDADSDFAMEKNEKIKEEALYHIIGNEEKVLRDLLDC